MTPPKPTAAMGAALCILALVATGTGAQTPPSAPAGDPAAGENLFYDHCVMCHVAEGGGQGPSLNGLYGRKAGSVDGYAYSNALKGSGIVWTAAALDHYLTNPTLAVPGSAMPVMVEDAKQRADLIAYFASKAKAP